MSNVRGIKILSLILSFFGIVSVVKADVIDTSHTTYLTSGTEYVETVWGANVSFFNATEQSAVDVHGGMFSFFDIQDSARAHIAEGSFSWITLNGSSQVWLEGGSSSWVRVFEESVLWFTGIGQLSWLVLDGNAVAHLYADDVRYDNGHLSGRWANGYGFQFWAVNEGVPSDVIPSNIIIHSTSEMPPMFVHGPIPVPTASSVALMLMGVGGLFVSVGRNRRIHATVL